MTSSSKPSASSLVRAIEDQLETDLEQVDRYADELLRVEEQNASLQTLLTASLERAKTCEEEVSTHQKTIREIRKKLWSLNITLKKAQKEDRSINAATKAALEEEETLREALDHTIRRAHKAKHHNAQLRAHIARVHTLCTHNLAQLQKELVTAHTSFHASKKNAAAIQAHNTVMADRLRSFSYLLTTVADDVRQASMSLEHRQTLIDLPDPPPPTHVASVAIPDLPEHPTHLLPSTFQHQPRKAPEVAINEDAREHEDTAVREDVAAHEDIEPPVSENLSSTDTPSAPDVREDIVEPGGQNREKETDNLPQENALDAAVAPPEEPDTTSSQNPQISAPIEAQERGAEPPQETPEEDRSDPEPKEASVKTEIPKEVSNTKNPPPPQDSDQDQAGKKRSKRLAEARARRRKKRKSKKNAK